MICATCGHELVIGDFPFCPHGPGSYNSQPNDIPGGLVIENLGREPVTVYSHSERRRLMRERGLIEKVEHVPMPGTDKSRHTTSWATTDPYTMEQARILAERQASTPGTNDPAVDPVPMRLEWIEGRGLSALKAAIGKA